MACPNKNRERSRTVAFRLTEEEFLRLEQRIVVTGEVKGDYLRAMALEGEINIFVGKYKSDKLGYVIEKSLNYIKVAHKEMRLQYVEDKLVELIILLEELKVIIFKTEF